MDTALKVAKILCLGGLFGLCLVVADTLKHVKRSSDALTQTFTSINSTVADADHAVTTLDARLNAHGGLLDILKATALHADRAVGEAAIASRQQRVAAERVDDALLGTVAHVNTVLDAVANDLHSTTLDVHNSLVRLPALLDATTATVTTANRTLSDANIPGALVDIDATMKHINAVAAHLETMSADLEKSLHKTLNPSKKSLALGYGLTALKFGAAVVPLF